MADSPAALIPPSMANPPNAKNQTLLRIHLSEPTLSLGDLFVGVYEHLHQLREGGHHGAADEMDNSQSVSRLIQIASDNGWQSFDTAWSAKEFREILYNAIAPDKGGPLWFRESLREPVLGDICTTQIPHVWKTLFDQAEDSIAVFVDPQSPHYAHLIQQISFQDMTALQGLWDKRSGTLSLKAVEDTLFPTASSSRIVRTSTSQVTGRTYKYSVTVLRTLDPQEYMDIFHRLARYALDQTPPPPPVTWNSLGKLAREVGLLTKNVLRHVVFWFKGYDIEETALWTLSRSWSDLLATGPFATRPSRDGASLTHVDRSPDDAARLFVQALFDQIRAGFQNDWKDKPTKGMASRSPNNPSPNATFTSIARQQISYRNRFHLPAWLKVVDLVKSYVGSQFQGAMEPYNEEVINSPLQTSLLSIVEPSIVTARLQCMEIPFLSTREALCDLTSEMQLFTAMYLYRRCNLFAASGQEITSNQASNVGDDVQCIGQEQGQRVRIIIDETARILQDAGYDPQPERQKENLDRFSLKSIGYYLLTEPNRQDAHTRELEWAIPSRPTGGVPSSPHGNSREMLTVASTNDSDVEQEEPPRIRRPRRYANH